jgi:hypothetical protein
MLIGDRDRMKGDAEVEPLFDSGLLERGIDTLREKSEIYAKFLL